MEEINWRESRTKQKIIWIGTMQWILHYSWHYLSNIWYKKLYPLNSQPQSNVYNFLHKPKSKWSLWKIHESNSIPDTTHKEMPISKMSNAELTQNDWFYWICFFFFQPHTINIVATGLKGIRIKFICILFYSPLLYWFDDSERAYFQYQKSA